MGWLFGLRWVEWFLLLDSLGLTHADAISLWLCRDCGSRISLLVCLEAGRLSTWASHFFPLWPLQQANLGSFLGVAGVSATRQSKLGAFQASAYAVFALWNKSCCCPDSKGKRRTLPHVTLQWDIQRGWQEFITVTCNVSTCADGSIFITNFKCIPTFRPRSRKNNTLSSLYAHHLDSTIFSILLPFFWPLF